MIHIQAQKDLVTDDLLITVKVPREHILRGRSTERSRHIASMIDMDQFFGMLRDVIDMKLGLEAEPTEAQGRP